MTLNHSHKLTGLIIARYGEQVDVETDTGEIQRIYLKRSLNKIVTGDKVLLENHANHLTITECLPRTSLLSLRAKKKPVAVNIDQLLLVISPKPLPTFALIDDYLIMAEALAIKPVIVFNKYDLLTATTRKDWHEKLKLYEELSYPLIFTSSLTMQGMQSLIKILQQKTSILVGQSGVGKSSIIQQLIPDLAIRIGQLSEQSQHGKHTTTTTRLYHLSFGGNLIDSPGIRSFSLCPISPEKMAACFVEFNPYLGQCRFANCQHRTEPDCAILASLKKGEIAKTRYTSYQRLMKFA